MLANALGRDGHEVTVANDGLAALEVRRAHEFDVILCDLRMPRLDGVGLLRRSLWLAKDFEALIDTAAAWLMLSCVKLLLRRLARV